MIWAVYLSVAVLLLVRLARQSLMPRRIERRATPVDDPDWAAQLREASAQLGLTRPVSLLRVKSSVIPMVWGTRRPVVVIPAEADGWPTEQRRTVLLHELAHVARHDCAVQVLTGVIAALYWFHPGVWWAGRRMRVERELACDDRVLGAGAHPHDYARQLLELAFMLRVPPALSFALGMARPSQLEVRMLAILDQSRERSAPARAAAWRISMGAAVCLIPLATTGFTQSASAEASASGVALAANASADPGSGTTSISAATGAPVDFPFTPDEVPFERPGVRRLRWEQQQASLSSSDPGSVREPTAELQPGRASGAAGTQSIHDAGIDPGGDSRVSLQIVSDSLTEEVSVRVLVERPERMSIVSVQPRDSSAIHRERETLTVVPTRRPRH
jgi:beta-lactamase regulating signal transducer with metallopeptidase domain